MCQPLVQPSIKDGEHRVHTRPTPAPAHVCEFCGRFICYASWWRTPGDDPNYVRRGELRSALRYASPLFRTRSPRLSVQGGRELTPLEVLQQVVFIFLQCWFPDAIQIQFVDGRHGPNTARVLRRPSIRGVVTPWYITYSAVRAYFCESALAELILTFSAGFTLHLGPPPSRARPMTDSDYKDSVSDCS